MSELATPPWELGKFHGDPYSIAADSYDVWWGWNAGRFTRVVRPDPNAANGRWPELAFMPYTVEAPMPGVWVPSYLTVAAALRHEARVRERREWLRQVERGDPISALSCADRDDQGSTSA